MRHVRTVSRAPEFAITGGGYGNTSIGEQLILLLMSMFFSDWENYSAVIQNLQKYYQKTPN